MLGPLLGIDLIIYFLTIILVFLVAKKTPKNSYYLKWLIRCIVVHVITLIWLRFCVIKVVPEEYINLFSIGRGFSLILLTIHIQSLLKGREEKLTSTDKIAFGVFLFLLAIFNLGVRFFNEPFTGSYLFNIEFIYADNPNKEVLLLWFSYLIFLFVRVYKKCLKNILNTNQLKHPLIYLLWINGYLLFIALNFWSSFLLIFEVNIPFIENLYLEYVFGIVTFALFILNPTILFHLKGPYQVKIINPSKSFDLKDTFINLLDKKKIFLKPRLSLYDFSTLCESNPIDIRNYILAQTGLNFNDYINGFRVSYSVLLMNKGYLESQSIYALGEECGFNSNQSFFRAFRKVYNTSPAKYFKLQILKT